MFIELAEALDCPACHDAVGLVAFVRTSDRRRVLSGSLGCPMCEAEFPISGGLIDFGAHEPGDLAPTAGLPREPAEAPATAVATKLAALLGLGERDGLVVLLGAGLGAHAAELARMAGRVEVIAIVEPEEGAHPDIEDLVAGVDPVRRLGHRWPFRSGALGGVGLRGRVETVRDEVSRCLVTGGRLVIVDPDPTDIQCLAETGFETLAADEETWVGVRS